MRIHAGLAKYLFIGKKVIIFTLLLGWFFSGWPQIGGKNYLNPPMVENARAAATTNATTWFLRSTTASTAFSTTGPTAEYAAATDATAAVPTAKTTALAMTDTPGAGQVTVGGATSGLTWFRTFLSPKLAAQTIAAGTVFSVTLGAYESNAGANAFTRMHVYVWREGTGVVATLRDGSGANCTVATEYTTAERGYTCYTVGTAAGQAILAGDQIAAEIWVQAATGYTENIYYNGTTFLAHATANSNAMATFGVSNVVTLESATGPTVTTQSPSAIGSTTSTANGTITNTGGENADKRGFVYDTSSKSAPGNVAPGSSGYASYAEDSGSYGAEVFTKGLTGLNTGTTYYVRAYAHNSSGYAYGDEVNFLTKPAAPTNAAATDGSYTDKVTITWTKSTGATNYRVYRDNSDVSGLLGDVATYDDSGAAAPTITPGTTVASDGSSTAQIDLSLSGVTANNGTTHTYKVVASNATGNSVDSATDNGYRGVGSLTYAWYKSAGDSDDTYSVISGATASTYSDNTTPAPTITPGTAVATDGTETSKVVLSISGASANAGQGRYYKCILNATGASQQTSAADRGYRGVGTLSYQWYRSSDDADSGFGSLGGATTAPFDDTTAPAPSITPGTASASDGTSGSYVTLSLTGATANAGAGRYYYCTLSATGAPNQDTSHDRGYRGGGTLTYQWQRSAADSDASYSDISGGSTAPYNDTEAPADGSGRYYKCKVDSTTGATQQISTADRGNKLVISITITANDTINYGTLPGAGSKSTIQLGTTPVVKNDGTGAEDFKIQGQNTACPWTLASSAGDEQYKYEVSSSSGSTWMPLSTSLKFFANNVSVNQTKNMDLRITVPSQTDCYTQQAVNVTVQASQP